jgi:hypothetical protein
VLVLTLLPATAPANPPAGTISFAGNGSLLDDGTVDVTLHYSCLPPGPGEIDVELDEGGTAFAFAISPLAACDGKNHSVTVNMAPGPFTPGVATGNATVFNFDAAVLASTSQQVMIK